MNDEEVSDSAKTSLDDRSESKASSRTKCKLKEGHPKPSQYVQSPLISVLVGEGDERKEFKIYKSLLTHESLFFKNALKDEWNQDDQITLEEEDPEVFGFLVDWMFDGHFSIPLSGSFMYFNFATAYCLADFLLMARAKNEIVDVLLNHWNTTDTNMNFFELKEICDGNALDTPLFDLCVRSATYRLMTNKTKELKSLLKYPEAMLAVLQLVSKWNTKPVKSLKPKDRCQYHDHKDGNLCTNSK